MQTKPIFKKCLAVGIILLFIGVAVAPSINSSVVKASNDKDLVEVTSQACGIQGFGKTTVKLTKQQYQNLEQYLVDFRARLNQTTTREEAVPLFKDAVVELNKYGLLPKGMSVEKAQKLVITNNRNKIQRQGLFSDSINIFCLFFATATPNSDYYPYPTLLPFGPICWLFLYPPALVLSALGFEKLANLWGALILILYMLIPLKFMNLIFSLGYDNNVDSFGLKGRVKGNYEIPFVIGFTGIMIYPFNSDNATFLGNALLLYGE